MEIMFSSSNYLWIHKEMVQTDWSKDYVFCDDHFLHTQA